jgi:hypothetical protein
MAADKVDFSDRKRTATRVRRAVDYAAEMETGDTIATCTVTAKDQADADVTGTLITGPAASGTKVLWTYLPWGTLAASYYVRVVATTTQGDVLPHVVKLEIEGA